MWVSDSNPHIHDGRDHDHHERDRDLLHRHQNESVNVPHVHGRVRWLPRGVRADDRREEQQRWQMSIVSMD